MNTLTIYQPLPFFGSFFRKLAGGGIIVPLAMAMCTPVLHGQIITLADNTTTATRLAKAPADECYTALGQNTPGDFPPCVAGQTLKVNQSYVWSEADTGDAIWFGTAANPLCLTQGEFTTGTNPPTPYQTPSYACEFGSSPYVPPLAARQGDYRPPRIYVWDKTKLALTEVTPRNTGPAGIIDPLDAQTLGFRAAGVIGNYVIFAGPQLTGGLAFFAYNIQTRQWIAKGSLSGYSDIRKLLNVNGVLYAGVAKTLQGGSILRFTGSFASIPAPVRGQGAGTCSACFSFSTVGSLDTEAASLAVHNGRMYVSTWPSLAGAFTGNGGVASIWMGPTIPTNGYTTSNASQWVKVWDITQYEPDPVIARSYGGGALASFGGYLYWGTMTVPGSGYDAWVAAYGQPTSDQQSQVSADTYRSAVMFRGFNATSPQPVDLLYGETQLWVYTPPAGGGTGGTWALTPNTMPSGPGTPPLYGRSGFNNRYNEYIWSMAVWQNKLWVGTFDASWLFAQFAAGSGFTPPPANLYGGDLWVFNDTNSAAVAEDTQGLGNYTSYGVRNLLPSGNSMYAGMANNANLLADPANPPNGGWELIQLQPK